MAIAHRGTGARTFSAATFSPVIPTAQVTGDIMLCLVTGKPYNSSITVPTSGWAEIGSGYTSGTTAAGVDVGSMVARIFWKEAASDTETDPAVTEGATVWNNMSAAVMVFSKAGGDTWVTPVVRGGGSTADPVDITVESDPGITTNDHVVTFIGYCTDAATPCTTHVVQTVTGVTFTDTHDPGTDDESILGGDLGVCMNRATVSGTSSATPHITSNPAAATETAGILVRLRVTAGAATSLIYPSGMPRALLVQ